MKESDLHRNASVVENRPLCADHYLLVMREDELARVSHPGQFVNLKINNREELLLRRPFSIARTHPEGSLFEIVYRVVGKGTAAMKDLKPGDILDLMGPLGKGFHLPEAQKNCLLIGGGVGLAPLWGLADRLSQNQNRIVALLGFRSSDVIFGIDVFQGYGAEIIVTTDDGSYGLKGFVSDHVEKVLKGTHRPRLCVRASADAQGGHPLAASSRDRGRGIGRRKDGMRLWRLSFLCSQYYEGRGCRETAGLHGGPCF